jgi:hypothetical protein
VATGTDGSNGQDGVTPRLRINGGFWQASYDEGSTWFSLGVAAGANGQDGQDGQNGVTPKIQINTVSDMWEISYDNGASWENTGIKATGENGEKGDAGSSGDAVFADNGIDYSNPDYVIFTLADGNTVSVPKYKKLGLNFTQPESFAAGAQKTIEYSPEGDVATIKFLNMPAGWTVKVDYAARTFTVTAPATFNSNNRGGEAIILISDNDQNTIMRTVGFSSNAGGGSDDGGDSGNDDEDDDEGGSSPGDGDDDDDTGPAGYITIDGYSGTSLTVYYTDETSKIIPKRTDNPLVDNAYNIPVSNKTIRSIILEGGTSVIAGRKADGSVISLKFSDGNLTFRDAIEGYIPIGTYSEFQLIQTKLNGVFKQEANLDLLNFEWAPVGNYSSSTIYFYGTFDGNNRTVANLKISGNNNYAGLFGYNRNGIIRNVHIISGSVSGGSYVGSVCGYNYGYVNGANNIISGCSNVSSVSGTGSYVGGVCGYSYAYSSSDYPSSANITFCHNTGMVSGVSYVGGVCGYSSSYHYNGSSSSRSSTYITSCYNTGSVSGSGDNIGGVCGATTTNNNTNTNNTNNNYTYSYITSCHNTGSVLGNGSNVGGVCGSSSSSGSSSSYYNYYNYFYITACYNTGSVSGNGNVGGVCGSSSSNYSNYNYLYITACYNTGTVSGSGSYVGGVCGYSSYSTSTSSLSVTACYNTGSVSGSGQVGGIFGGRSTTYGTATLTACYWTDVSGDGAEYGTGNTQSNAGTTIFGIATWPITGTHQQWGTGDGSGDGKYWKALGGWGEGNPVYPKMWFEE